MKRDIKLHAQTAELPERKVRLRLAGRLAGELDEYRELYARVHGQEIDLPALIEGILAQFLASDRAFQRQRRGGTRTGAASTMSRVGEPEDPET